MGDLPPYSTPRWVKLLGIVVLILVLMVGIVLLTGVGGVHGPGRHMPSGAAGAKSLAGGAGDHTPFGGRPDGRTPPIDYRVQPS